MEVFNLPLSIVIAMWMIRRLGNPRPKNTIIVRPVHELDVMVIYINKVMRIESPLYVVGWLENKLRLFVSKYRNDLRQESENLARLGVETIGYIKKGDK